MLVTPDGLSATDLAAIAELERRVVTADGGRLKLEWDSLRSRPPGLLSDALWWDGQRLAGFAGVYTFGSMTPEVAGMVSPAARRQGIGSTLLRAALKICHERGRPAALLVVPRAGAGGHALARRLGGRLEHSEHALTLTTEPVADRGAASSPPITVRDATASDIPVVAELLRSAFGYVAELTPTELVTPAARTLLVELAGEVVATLRVSTGEEGAGIYGFGVREDLRGRGIGRATLLRVCHDLRTAGTRRIGLEVSVDNEHALGLYTGIGFVPVITEDYYRMDTSPL